MSGIIHMGSPHLLYTQFIKQGVLERFQDTKLRNRAICSSSSYEDTKDIC